MKLVFIPIEETRRLLWSKCLVSPQNSYVEILTFKVMILRDGPWEVIKS